MKLTFTLIGICVLVFFLQIGGVVGGTLAFMPAKVVSEPWLLLSSMFMHGDINHLLLNMLGLFTFGVLLENIVEKKEWVILYFTGGFIASFGYMLLTSSPFSTAVGASGAIFGLMGGLAVIKPRQVIWTMYGPLPMLAAAFLWGIIEFFSLYSPDNIAHSAHLFGMIGGAIIGLMYIKKLNWKWTILPGVACLGLIFFVGYGMPTQIYAYNIGEDYCNLVDDYSSISLNYQLWSCEGRYLFSRTSPSRSNFNLARSESEITSFASSIANTVYKKDCASNSTFINNVDKTAFVNGDVCGHNFYGIQKKCGQTEVTVIEFSDKNQSISQVSCDSLGKYISS
jgi:uncharacterized protein